jgi:pyruvate dehydrogenase E2 component (dihydrolipoamide acetyltransferase)
MSVEIVMPQLGLTMTEGSVSTWIKKPGDSVTKDEIILAVATDKVDMDVESPTDGILGKILIDAGIIVPVGTVLTHIIVDGDEPEEHVGPPAAAAEPEKSLPPEKEQTSQARVPEAGVRASAREGRTLASPRAKKLAAARGIDLESVNGSGPHGRIVAADVEAAFPQHRVSNEPAAGGNARRRQLIADRMVESITTIPAFSVTVEADARHLVALYENLRARIEQVAGVKLTYTDLLLKALAVGLAQTPEMNTLWENGAPRRLSDATIAMAVATERGVVAPVLKSIDTLPLEQLVQSRLKATQKARESKLTFEDLEGSSGTLSNLGMYRVDRFEGIITPGQTFILAVGQLKKRPWVVDNALTVTPTLILNLSVDHRVVDGAGAAKFLGEVAEAIENPYQLLWNVDAGKRGK